MKRVLAAALFCSFAGCVPVDLQVNSKGELIIPREEGFFRYDPAGGKVVLLPDPPPGKPVCARLTSSGTEVLLVTKTREPGEFRDVFRCELVPMAGGKGRTLYRSREVGNVQFSPDGAQLAVIRFEGDQGELLVVDVKTGEARSVLKKVGPFVRWFSDSKRLVVFQIEGQKNFKPVGNIATCEAASGKTTPLAAVLAEKTSSLDLSPDNRKVLFSAGAAGKVGTQLAPDKDLRTHLFEVDLAGGEVRSVQTQAIHVRYSPGGKKVLLTRRAERAFLGTTLELVVADAGLTSLKTIASDTFGQFISLGLEHERLPGWLDDDRLFYFTERMVFGAAGKALHMVLIGADGANRKFVQPDIDEGVEKARAAAKLDGMK